MKTPTLLASSRFGAIHSLLLVTFSITVLVASTAIPALGSGTFHTTGSMNLAREGHTATLLSNGQVLVAGGAGAGYLASAELYNPANGTWTLTGSMNVPRKSHQAVRLQDGEVLAIAPPVAPALLLLTQSPPRLPNGEVFVTGGFASGNASYSTAALYDPPTGQFTLEAGPCSCRGFNGALLQTGKVLVAGGAITVRGNPYPSTETINSAELWDLSTQAWTSTGNMHDSRFGASMTVLQNGQALVAGGSQSTKHSNGFVILSSAELYTP